MGGMPPVVTDAPFVGRRAHLRRFGELLGAVTSGQPAAALVGGDAGVGKTRLVAEFAAVAARRGFLVATGRSVDLGAGGLPYLPFVDALRALARAGGPAAEAVRRATAERPDLLRLVGRSPQGPPLAEADRLPLFDAVAALLARVADDVAPVLLVLEDLHWADASTRDLLRFVLSRLREERLLVVGTFRTDDLHRRHPLRPLLAELVRLPGVERLDLAPFDAAELGRLLAGVAGAAVPAAVTADIARRSGGNAFFALELLAAHAPADDGRLVPDALNDVLLARLDTLSAPAQQVVRAASVAGRCVDDALLRRALGDGTGDLDGALREAVDRHVLLPDGPVRYTFRHALLQEAVYADLLPGERVRLHAGYARALADTAPGDDDAAADLAEHALRSHDLPVALAASWQAARTAQERLAPHDALEHAEQALALWDAVPADRRPPGVAHADVLLLAASLAGGSGDTARACALSTAARDEALAAGDEVTAARARRHLARHMYGVDRLEECIEQARLARATLLAHPPSADLVWATATLVTAMTVHEQDDEAIRLARAGLALAGELGVTAAEADLRMTLALLEAQLTGDVLGAEPALRAARDLARAAGEPAIELRAQWNIGSLHHEADQLEQAAQAYREADRRARETGLAASLYAVEARLALLEVLYRLGRWDEVLALAQDGGLRLAPRDTRALRIAALRVTAAREPQRVAAEAAAVRAAAEAAGDQGLSAFDALSLGATEAVAALWCGDPDTAVDLADAAFAALDAGPDRWHPVAVRLAAVGLAAIAAGGRATAGTADRWLARAEQTFTTARPTRGRGIGPEGRAWLLRARAEHARVVTGGPAAAPLWQDALALVEGQPDDEATVRLRLAEALAATGDRPGAAAHAARAHALARDLGAGPLRAAVEAVARRHRLDLGGGVPPADGPLTPREGEVLRLVAAGLTNRAIGERLFISEKTASVHVSNILAKLGASGRTEAVAIAGRRGLLPAGSP